MSPPPWGPRPCSRPQAPLQARGPHPWRTCQCSSTVDFIIETLPLLLSQILPSCQQARALPGSVPGPESHSQTPAASKLGNTPELFYLPDSFLPYPQRAHPSAPLLASQGCPDTSACPCSSRPSVISRTAPQTAPPFFPLLLGLFITREPRIPFSKCLLVT